MSADNSVARGGLDAQTQAGQAAFQIPPELATRYQVRIIEPSDGSERRVGMFLPTDRENPSIEIAGDRILARNEDPETVSALVTIAKHNGWAGIDVEGSSEFRQAVWTAASREGLTVRGYEPSFDEQARMEELRRADAARRDREVAEKPAPTVEPVAPTAAVGATEATVLAPSADAERNGAPQPLPSGSSTELSDADKRLLLTVSVHTQDRKALYAAVSEDMDPLRREVQAERIDLNRDALNGALERALESPTLVSAFSRSGYEPDGLRQDGARRRVGRRGRRCDLHRPLRAQPARSRPRSRCERARSAARSPPRPKTAGPAKRRLRPSDSPNRNHLSSGRSASMKPQQSDVTRMTNWPICSCMAERSGLPPSRVSPTRCRRRRRWISTLMRLSMATRTG